MYQLTSLPLPLGKDGVVFRHPQAYTWPGAGGGGEEVKGRVERLQDDAWDLETQLP